MTKVNRTRNHKLNGKHNRNDKFLYPVRSSHPLKRPFRSVCPPGSDKLDKIDLKDINNKASCQTAVRWTSSCLQGQQRSSS